MKKQTKKPTIPIERSVLKTLYIDLKIHRLLLTLFYGGAKQGKSKDKEQNCRSRACRVYEDVGCRWTSVFACFLQKLVDACKKRANRKRCKREKHRGM